MPKLHAWLHQGYQIVYQVLSILLSALSRRVALGINDVVEASQSCYGEFDRPETTVCAVLPGLFHDADICLPSLISQTDCRTGGHMSSDMQCTFLDFKISRAQRPLNLLERVIDLDESWSAFHEVPDNGAVMIVHEERKDHDAEFDSNKRNVDDRIRQRYLGRSMMLCSG